MLNPSQEVVIIAEAGVNHNGDINLAFELIDAAADAGADFVKFQTFDASKLASKSAKKARYQMSADRTDMGQLEMLKRLELSYSDHEKLVQKCNERSIGFFSTAFDLGSLDFLYSLGLSQFKVPSGEITNLPYLRRVASFGKPLIVSTGMSTVDEIRDAIGILIGSGLSKNALTLLHCTSEYPAPLEGVNLNAMRTLGDTFDVSVGYSDHTPGIEVSLAAVALGATVIEKHFTLDRDLPGPDHAASLQPSELQSLVINIKRVLQALGSNLKSPTVGELQNRPLVRKSIVASRRIDKGERFTETNLTTKRPGTGLSPMLWDQLIGSRAIRVFEIDEEIKI